MNNLIFARTKYIILIIIRIIAPLFIFTAPLPATIACIVLDFDANLAYRAHLSYRQYHFWDKIADWWFYLFILLYSQQTSAGALIYWLFVYRSIGQLLSIITGKTKFLIFFPNVLEVYFLIYLLAGNFWTKTSEYFHGLLQIYLFFLSTILAIGRELTLHSRVSRLRTYLEKLGLIKVNRSWVEQSEV